VSRAEREQGCDDLESGAQGADALRDGNRSPGKVKNTHPTLKAIELTRWLATLLLPPCARGRVRRILVPFSGAGSEMIGCLQAGWDEVVGIEGEEKYIAIAKARITKGGIFSGLLDKKMRAKKRERE
jgi:site-specific DNA-methyltransferase (adenine-specific)